MTAPTQNESAPLPPPRTRFIVGINIISFSWSIGLGASIPLIPLFSYQFVPNLALAGVVTAIGGVGSMFASYISGPMIDRWGRQGVTAFGIAMRMVFSFAEGLPRNYQELAFYRFMSAIGTSIYGTGSQVMLADISTRQNRGSVLGGRQVFMNVGMAIGPALGGWLWGITGSIRYPFFFNGFSKLVCLITFFTLMGETKDFDRPAPSANAEGSQPRIKLSRSALLKAVFVTGFFYCIYQAFATTLFRQGITNVILPVYTKEILDLSQTEVGALISAISVGNLIISYPAGYISDRFGVRISILPGLVLSVATLVLFAVSGGASIPLAMAMGMGTGLTEVGSRAFAVDIAPRETRGQFFGIQLAVGNFAQLLGPLAIGTVTDQLGFGFPFFFLAGIYAVMIPLCLISVRDAPRETPQPQAGEAQTPSGQ